MHGQCTPNIIQFPFVAKTKEMNYVVIREQPDLEKVTFHKMNLLKIPLRNEAGTEITACQLGIKFLTRVAHKLPTKMYYQKGPFKKTRDKLGFFLLKTGTLIKKTKMFHKKKKVKIQISYEF